MSTKVIQAGEKDSLKRLKLPPTERLYIFHNVSLSYVKNV